LNPPDSLMPPELLPFKLSLIVPVLELLLAVVLF
jgi:hypothetical protein